MPQLLIELFSEEIPARMQAQAARDLDRMARERLGRSRQARRMVGVDLLRLRQALNKAFRVLD
jgi:glycyl-tRNA synthetase beta subunit